MEPVLVRGALKMYPRVMWWLSVALVISAIGESFLWPLTTTYIVHSFGKSLQVAASVLMLQYSGTLIGNVVGGLLFDKWSGRKTVAAAISFSILLLILMGTLHSFPLYLVLLFLLGLCNGTFWPSTRAFAAILWPEGGRTGMNMLYVANNLGVAIGASVGGLVASQSFRLAFYGNALTYVLFLILFLSIIQERHLQRRAPAAKKDKGAASAKAKTSPREWASLGVLIVGLMVLVINYSQWQTTISTYVQDLGISLSSYSLLWAVNGVVIVLCQPILSWFIAQFRWNLKAQILIGGCFFALAALTIAVFTQYAAFVMGMVIVTWGEMLVWPAVPAIAAEMAPFGQEGFFQGIATTGQSVGRMLGPLVGSLLYEAFSPSTMLSIMVLLAVAAWVGFYFYDWFVRKSK